MRTKWASYSSKKNITLNRLIAFLPEDVISYVIYHEMAHGIERKHNKRLWTIIARRFKNYSRYERELFVYWFLIYKDKMPYKRLITG